MRVAAVALALVACVPWPCGWMAPARAVLVQESDPNALYGIGAVLVIQNAAATVEALAPGGAADKEGELKPGDVIIAVAQADGPFVDCTALPLDKIVAMVRGKKGTTVRLKVMSNGVSKVVGIQRAEIKQAVQVQGAGQIQININAGALQVLPPMRTRRPVPAIESAPRDPLKNLPAADAAKLADFIKHADQELEKVQMADMKAKVDQVAAATGLDDKGKKALTEAAAVAVDQAAQKSDAGLADILRISFVSVPPGQMHQVLQQVSSMEPMFAKMYQQQTDIWPTDFPAWQAGLKQALTPAQAALWTAAEAQHKQDVEADSANYLVTVRKTAENMVRQQLDPEAADIRGAVNLPADRIAAVNTLEGSIITDAAAKCSARIEKALIEMPDTDRKLALNTPSYNLLPPAVMDQWKAGIAKVLTPEQLLGMKSAKEDRLAVRADAMGKILLTLMDDWVALTATQRQQLEPIAQDLMRSASEVIAEPDQNEFYSVPVSQILAVGVGGADDQIKAILDENQWRHWQDAAAGKNASDNEYEQQSVQLPAAGASATATATQAPVQEPDAVEKAISKYMADKSDAERQKVFAERELKAEDASRILHLPADAAQRLTTAACGAADAFMTGWSNAAEQAVRSNLGTVTAETINQRLQNIQGYQLQQAESNSGSGSPQDSVWDTTVKNVLNQDQIHAWKTETDARQQYESDAVCNWVTVSFAQRFALSPDQQAKLGSMIAKIMKKYGDRFGNYFQGDAPWYLETYYMFLPVAGIEDKDLGAILTKDQVDRWKGSNVHAEAAMYWQNIAR
jgi:hypothetical protein